MKAKVLALVEMVIEMPGVKSLACVEACAQQVLKEDGFESALVVALEPVRSRVQAMAPGTLAQFKSATK